MLSLSQIETIERFLIRGAVLVQLKIQGVVMVRLLAHSSIESVLLVLRCGWWCGPLPDH